jgi:membrane protein
MRVRTILGLFRTATLAWWKHQSPARSAAVAFYALIAMAPIMVVGVVGAGRIFRDDTVREMAVEEIGGVAGQGPAEIASAVIDGVSRPQGGLGASLIAILVVIAATTAVFGQLHIALNQIWRVEEEDHRKFIRFVRRRFLSLVIVFSLGLAILASVVLRVALGSMSQALSSFGAIPSGTDWGGSGVPIYVGVFLLFWLLNHVLPDARVRWSVAALGGSVSATLFIVGAWAVSAYLVRAGMTSAYGAAGSLVVTLMWVYYSSMVFLWGAEVARSSHLVDQAWRISRSAGDVPLHRGSAEGLGHSGTKMSPTAPVESATTPSPASGSASPGSFAAAHPAAPPPSDPEAPPQ